MTEQHTKSVLVLGEALVDLVFDPRQDEPQPTAVPGGSPANVALTLGRLGIEVELLTWIGRDDFGNMISAHLADSHVRIVEGSDAATFTPTAEAHLDQSGAATYTFNLEWNPPAANDIAADVAVVHTGSIGAVLEPGTHTILEAFQAARPTALTTYDPNARPSLMGSPSEARQVIEVFAAASDVIKVSDEDLEWLYPGVAAVESAKEWVSRFSLPLLVLTRGKDGPIAWTSDGTSAEVTPAQVEVIDTVGAGDSFMGGLIDALWRRDLVGPEADAKIRALAQSDLEGILKDASLIADIVVQRRGANPPWASELGR